MKKKKKSKLGEKKREGGRLKRFGDTQSRKEDRSRPGIKGGGEGYAKGPGNLQKGT